MLLLTLAAIFVLMDVLEGEPFQNHTEFHLLIHFSNRLGVVECLCVQF